jgi:hypothetical protein
MMRFLIAATLLLLVADRLAAAEPLDADALRKAVEDVGGKITFSEDGKPVEIDLYNGNNPLKGKGGRNTAVNDAWLEKLAGLTTLTSLSLANCDVHAEGMKHVAKLTKLENLNLTLTPVSDDGLAHLVTLTELKSLGLASSQCTGTGFKHLHGLKKLSNVNMHFTPANDAGLAAIAEMPNLERLWVVHAKFTDEVASSLGAHKNLKRLGIGSSLKESSGKALSFIGGMPLTELDIYDKQATDEAIGYVAAIPTLRLLSISYAPDVTDVIVDSLLKLPALEELKIGPSKLTDAGLLRLAELKSLKTLSVARAKKAKAPGVTDAGIESLKKARPDLTIDVK